MLTPCATVEPLGMRFAAAREPDDAVEHQTRAAVGLERVGRPGRAGGPLGMDKERGSYPIAMPIVLST